MLYKRKLTCFLLILCLILTIKTLNNKSQGASSIMNNIFENSLSEDAIENFFDLNKGMLKYSFKKENNDDVLRIDRGILYSKKDLPSEFTLTVNLKLTGASGQCSLELGRREGETSSLLNISQEDNNIGLFDGINKQVNLDYTGKLLTNKWYKLTLIAKDKLLHIYIDNAYFDSISKASGFEGGFLFRLATGESLELASLSVFDSSAIPVKEEGAYGKLEGFSKYMLPGLKQNYTYLSSSFSDDKIQIRIKDAAGLTYEQLDISPKNGAYDFSFIPRGKAGIHTIEFSQGKKVFSCEIYLEAITTIDCPDQEFNDFFRVQREIITKRNQKVQNIFGYEFKGHMSWLRDHIHMMKASIYWDRGAKDSINFWINQQHESGFFYEMYVVNDSAPGRSYISNSNPEFVRPIDKNNSLVRFEIEADIEYMMVEAVYLVWQATNDLEWMQSTLANLDKAMTWTSTDPKRWSKELGLMIRGSSVDTYDFTYGHTTSNRRIVWWEKGMDWGTAMAVFHGDNTGFYQSCNMLSRMYLASGNKKRASHWEGLAKSIKTNLMKLAWNGSYFAHMVQVHPKFDDLPESFKEDFGGDWLRLSLSNAYALNRNFLSDKEATSIIKSFMDLRDNPPKVETVTGHSEETLFAEWITIYPSYRKKEYVKYDVGTYINGTIAPFTAGELANGTFKYGFPEYGFDILTRLNNLYKRDGTLGFFYTQTGEIYTHVDGSEGGPPGWGTSTIYRAIIEGLAGINDNGQEFNSVTISPAFVVADYDSSYASSSYGLSDKYIAYSFEHIKKENRILYTIVGDSKEIALKLLLPTGKHPNTVSINGQEMAFETIKQNDSVYASLTYIKESSLDVDYIELSYGDKGQGPEDIKKKTNAALLIIEALIGLVIIATTITILLITKNNKSEANS